jgi:hypothetical protein
MTFRAVLSRRGEGGRAMGRPNVRSISELIYAPVEGAEPEVTSCAEQSELGALPPAGNDRAAAASTTTRQNGTHGIASDSRSGRPARRGTPVRAEPVQPKGRASAPASPPGYVVEAWNQRYRSDLIRMARVKQ